MSRCNISNRNQHQHQHQHQNQAAVVAIASNHRLPPEWENVQTRNSAQHSVTNVAPSGDQQRTRAAGARMKSAHRKNGPTPYVAAKQPPQPHSYNARLAQDPPPKPHPPLPARKNKDLCQKFLLLNGHQESVSAKLSDKPAIGAVTFEQTRFSYTVNGMPGNQAQISAAAAFFAR